MTAEELFNSWLLENEDKGEKEEDVYCRARKLATSLCDERIRAWENEVNAFGVWLCKEIYQRPFTKLSKEELEHVNDIIFQVDQWKKANQKEGYVFADAYALMNGASIN
jgi:hypothetical protein